jgi:hydrogenase maturation protein HypF
MSGLAARRRIRIRVQGTVQGVGFRPFVYRLAHEQGLAGHVLNDRSGVEIEVEGAPHEVAGLLTRITAEAPPLAVIDRISTTELVPAGLSGFGISDSVHDAAGEADVVVAPDTATCVDCLAELLDRRDRRYRYPFINCTNCGPRLTIITGAPYDREQTTMRRFVMCAACAAEYGDPRDRRFHAQPNACPECGPHASLLAPDRTPWVAGATAASGLHGNPVAAAARLLGEGAIVAVKGLGGYHLAVLASDDRAVARLRSRKHREHKPFALVVSNVRVAATLVALSDPARALLMSTARPIVLAPRLKGARVAASVAPGSPELGVMLSHTPLHHLLLHDVAAVTGDPAILVMTSANLSDEPMAYEDDEAFSQLGDVADAFLTHNRPIRHRVDDSVARFGAGGVRMLRRSRGYVPAPLTLPVPARAAVLACGAELKSTFCLARGPRAWLSHHLGDLGQYAARASYADAVGQYEQLLGVRPQLVVHDLHPSYASTAYAMTYEGVQRLAVQHHHAHLAACLAEYGYGPETVAVGAIFDGSGYGSDGTVWGGEVLVGGLLGFERIASLLPIRLPGGEAAIREPWRVALAWLTAALGDSAGDGRAVAGVPAMPPALLNAVDPRHWRAVAQVARDPSLSPVTSSVGRLFDAVAALCGLAPRVSYEGQAAMELTVAAAWHRPRAYEIAILETGPTGVAQAPHFSMDPRQLITQVSEDFALGIPVGEIAAGFHVALARMTAKLCAHAASESGTDLVVLSGGVFQNPLLLELCAAAVTSTGLRVLIPSVVPANDGGISYGQAAIAAARPIA